MIESLVFKVLNTLFGPEDRWNIGLEFKDDGKQGIKITNHGDKMLNFTFYVQEI